MDVESGESRGGFGDRVVYLSVAWMGNGRKDQAEKRIYQVEEKADG